MTRQNSAQSGVTVFYDASCGVCSWIARQAVRAACDNTVTALPIDTAEGHLDELSDEVRWASWHVLDADGRLHSAGAAAPVLLERLPHTRLPVLLIRTMPHATERLYRLGARTRSLWGRLVPKRSVARARRELALLTSDNRPERQARCTMTL